MPMDSACGSAALPALGFPIRESTDHRLFSAYSWLIAAVHALHRLLVPRHPPCALHILTVITHSTCVEHAVIPVTLEKLYSFQGPLTKRAPAGTGRRSLKTQQHARRSPEGSRPRHTRRRWAGGRVQVRSTLLGPGRSARCSMQLEGGSG